MNYKETKHGIVISVKVIPNAHKNEIVGWEDGRLKMRVTAVPEKGRANEAVEELVAKLFKVSKSSVSVIKGHTSREKTVEIRGDFNGMLALP